MTIGDSFECTCAVRMKIDDQTIIEAFEKWMVNPNCRFVNPTRKAVEIIKGALILAECGVGGQGIVRVKLNMVDGELLAVKVIDYQTFRGQFTSLMGNEIRNRQSDVERLCHPCLVKVRGSCLDDRRRSVTTFMNYVKGPSLDDSYGPFSSVNLRTVLEKRPSWWTKPILSIVILGVAHGI